MAAGSEALVLKVSADTSEVASGLAPMTKALDTLAHEADAAADELRQLDAVDVKLSVRDEALAKARSDIERLRNEIAHGITMGLDTKGAQRELSQLESAVRKLADKPERVEMEVEVDKEALATAVEGVDSLREGALGLGEAVGALDGTLVSFGQVMRETVPALADLNQTMAAMKLRNEAAGRSFGVLGRSVSAVTGVMAGPWGLAIAAGVGLLAGWASKQEDAADATENFTDAINYQTGALDRANREAAAKTLQDAHMLDTAEQLGISTQDMVSALAGERDAYIRVTDAIGQKNLRTQADMTLTDDYKASVDDFTHKFFGMTVQMFGARDASGAFTRAVGEMAGAADGARFVVGNLSDDVSHNADLWLDYGDAVDESRKALDDIIGSIDILNGRFASVREATSNYEQSLDDVNEAIKENGRAVTKGGAAFAVSTQKGRDNEKALREMAKASGDLTKARLADADASGESTDDIMADYDKQRTSLYKTALRMGLNETAANKYVDSLMETPEEVSTAVALTGYDKAKAQMSDITKDRTAVVNVVLNVDKFMASVRRGIAGARAEFGGALDAFPSNNPRAAPPPAAAPKPGLTLLQPRLYLDSRPIRAALRNDVTSTVAAQLATTRHRGRL